MKKEKSLQYIINRSAFLIAVMTAVAIFLTSYGVIYNNIEDMIYENTAQTAKIERERIKSVTKSVEQLHINTLNNFSLLINNINDNNLITHVFFLDSQNNLLDSYPGSIDLYDLIESKNLNVLNNEETYWSQGIYIEELEGKYILLSIPKQATREISLISLNNFNENIASLQLDENIQINIYDRSSNLIAGSDYNPDSSHFLQRPIIMNFEESTVVDQVFFADNNDHITAYTPIEKNNWVIESSINKNVAFSPFENLIPISFFVLILIFSLIFILTQKTFNRILKPLKFFVEQMHKVRKGCYDKIVERKSSVIELNFLQQKFKEMVSLIKKREDELKSLSAELQQKNQKLEQTKMALNKQLEKGSELHKRFLPAEYTDLDIFEVNTYHQASKKLGGDFYNIINADDYIINYIADVTGHGLDGAFLNIFIREKINSFLYNNDKEKFTPAKILCFVLKEFKKENIPSDYFTAIMLTVYNKKSGKFLMSNAGIHFPMLLKREEEIEEILVKEMPISQVIPEENYNFEEKEINVKKNDLIIMTTDGLIEEYVNGHNYGWDRFKKLLKNTENDYKEAILTDFKKFKGELLSSDDITFMLIKIK